MEVNTMQTEIPEDTSRRITSLRFLLAMLVVFIHNQLTSEGFLQGNDIHGAVKVLNQSAFGAWVEEFISKGLAAAAVPLFFCFSAYLQAKKDDAYPVLLKKKTRTLFIPFVLWTGIYFFCTSGLKYILSLCMPSLFNKPEQTIALWTVSDWIYELLGYKFSGGLQVYPMPNAVQLWFVRDLIILTVCSPLLVRIIKKVPVLFFCVVSAFLFLSIDLHIVQKQSLFFYITGLYWGMKDIPLFEEIDRIKWFEIVPLFIISFFMCEFFSADNSTTLWWMVLCCCGLFLKLSRVISENERLYAYAKYLAGFSFFLYAIHLPLLFRILQTVWLRFFPMENTFFCLLDYFMVAFLIIAVGTGLGILLRKICPPVFRLLNGGR